MRGVQQQIVGVFVAAKLVAGIVSLSGEHDAYLWIDPANRTDYDVVPPDCDAIDVFAAKVR